MYSVYKRLHNVISLAENFTFSSKERDVETGLSYFGARYYSSELSLWLSVDPMSDKYPHQSNYVYCSNNPLNVIDPNGEDEYEFDGVGNMRMVKKTEFDSFHKIDPNGNRTGEALFYNEKVVSEQIVIEGNSRNPSYFRIDNAAIADEFFSFLSDNVELDGGEFSNSVVQDQSGSIYNLIGADIDAVKGESYTIPNLLSSEKYSVVECTHNHYSGKTSPSRSDVYYAKKHPNTNFYIRTIGNVCTSYDKETRPDYDWGSDSIKLPLNEVIIR